MVMPPLLCCGLRERAPSIKASRVLFMPFHNEPDPTRNSTLLFFVRKGTSSRPRGINAFVKRIDVHS
jgi:hypothetical protein